MPGVGQPSPTQTGTPCIRQRAWQWRTSSAGSRAPPKCPHGAWGAGPVGKTPVPGWLKSMGPWPGRGILLFMSGAGICWSNICCPGNLGTLNARQDKKRGSEHEALYCNTSADLMWHLYFCCTLGAGQHSAGDHCKYVSTKGDNTRIQWCPQMLTQIHHWSVCLSERSVKWLIKNIISDWPPVWFNDSKGKADHLTC